MPLGIAATPAVEPLVPRARANRSPVALSVPASSATFRPLPQHVVLPVGLLAGWRALQARRATGCRRGCAVQLSASALEEQVRTEEENDGFDELPNYWPNACKVNLDDTLPEDTADDGTEEICEIIGYDMSDNLERELGRPFREHELKNAYEMSGFYKAESHEKPAAIWLIGPSACGKSTRAPELAEICGMSEDDYVTVDGDAFRDAHEGYQKAVEDGHQHGCVFWGAYVGIRETINEEKQVMLDKAMQERKNMIIPSTCLRRSQCIDVAKMLRSNGYAIHIAGVYGDKATIIARGRKRSAARGKRYEPREFEVALTRFAPMLRLCTAKWIMVRNTGDNQGVTGQGDGPLSEQQIKEICEGVFADVC